MVRTDNVLVKKFYGVNTPCNAPSNNMYFTVTGKAAPCWKLPGLCDQWSEERSIMDMTGHKSTEMVRRYIKEANLFKNNPLNKMKI